MKTDAEELAASLHRRRYEYVPKPEALKKISTLPPETLEDTGFLQCVGNALERLWRAKTSR